MRHPGLLLVLIPTFLLGLWAFWPSDESATIRNDSPVEAGFSKETNSAYIVSPDVLTFLDQSDDDTELPPLPASLRGTKVDGSVSADDKGRLIIDPDLRLVFDYFLSAIGEEELDVIVRRIRNWMAERLPPAALAEAMGVLQRYLGYLDELAEIPEHDGTLEGMQRSLIDRRNLRTAWLGQEINEAFFGFEDAYDDYSLLRLQMDQDNSLTETERQRRLDLLKADWPDEVRELMQDIHMPGELERLRDLQQQGASSAEIRALREQKYGHQATERLEALDQERNQWQARYQHYRAQVEALIESGLAPSSIQQEQQRLRQNLFQQDEWRRVEALDSLQTDQE